jgi:ABC-type glutathione transport system ATPase component
MAKLLEVKNLKVSFRQEGKQVNTINGVSFSLNYGETLGIVGESGCGKSVTSLSIMGLLRKGFPKSRKAKSGSTAKTFSNLRKRNIVIFAGRISP